jgi:uncharacterized integral membrane protein (TIGR00698 family)
MQVSETLARSQRGVQISYLIGSIVLLLALTIGANRLAVWGPSTLEFPIWAAGLGLIANIVFSLLGLKQKLNQAFQSELFLKIGLVLLGAGVNLTEIASVGLRGIIQAVIVITAVFFFTWWLAGLFKLDNKLRAVMSAAVSICGVSAAIAATGAVVAKRQQLAYVTALVILVTLPLMVLGPWVADQIGMSPAWAGAWFGGNIDTTAAVVGAGTIYGEEAVKVATIVKLSQNALIGVAAFLLALYWAVRVEQKETGQKPSARLIWDRFPKFVLGFILLSILASLAFFGKEQVADLKNLRQWSLALAFVGIGWGLTFSDFKEIGAKPIWVFLGATIFNTVLAFIVSWIIFG